MSKASILKFASILLVFWVASYAAIVTPTYTAPTIGTTSTPIVTFNWRAAGSTATQYHIQISTAPFSTSTLILDSIMVTPKCTVNVVLDYGLSIEWQVRGETISSTGTWSAMTAFSTASLSNAFGGTISPGGGVKTITIHRPFNTTTVAQTTSDMSGYYSALYTTLNSGYICFSATNFIKDSAYFYNPGLTPTVNKTLIGIPLALTGAVKNSKGIAISGVTLSFFDITPTMTLSSVTTNGSGLFSQTIPYYTVASYKATKNGYTFAGNMIGSTADVCFTGDTGHVGIGNLAVEVANFTATDVANPTVSLTAPAGGETWTVGTGHNITWTASDNESIASRALYFSTDNGSNWSLVDSATGSSGTYSWTIPNQVSAQCKVKAIAYDPEGNHASSTSPAFTIQVAAPGTPTLSSPADAATNVPVSQTISWGSVSGATGYDVTVSVHSDFSSPTVSTSTTNISYDLSSLTNNQTYYWRVRATNSGGQSAWASRSFTTIVSLPSTPVLASPADNATNVPTPQSLSWGSASGATGYDLVVSANSDFSAPVVNTSKTGTNHDLAGLSNDAVYYWRVRSTNVAGNSSWASRSFRTIVATPNVPVVSSPSNGAADVSLTPTVAWGAVAGSTSYQLQVATNNAFASPALDETVAGTSKALSLSNGTTYYVRVNSSNAGGTSAWSSTVSFTTIPSAPGAPVLVSPVDGAVNQPVAVTLKWRRIAGATYGLQVLNGGATVVSQTGLTDTAYNLSSLSNSTAYAWKVSASNSGGTGAWSSTRAFTTIDPVPSAVTILSPADGYTSTVRNVTVMWAKPAYADSFHVVVAGALDTTVTDTFLTLNMDNGLYSVSIMAKNEAGVGAGTSVSFIVNVPTTGVVKKTGMPFTGVTASARGIQINLAESQNMSLLVYDIKGRLVASMRGFRKTGGYFMPLSLADGNYYIKFVTGDFRKTLRLTIFR